MYLFTLLFFVVTNAFSEPVYITPTLLCDDTEIIIKKLREPDGRFCWSAFTKHEDPEGKSPEGEGEDGGSDNNEENI